MAEVDIGFGCGKRIELAADSASQLAYMKSRIDLLGNQI